MKRGIAIDMKTNQWVETASLTDDDLQAALGDGPTPWWFEIVVIAVIAAVFWFTN